MKKATRVCAERDKGVRTGNEIATRLSLRSERDGFAVATRPQNAAYRAIAFTGSAPESYRQRTCSWIAVQNYLILTLVYLRLSVIGARLEPLDTRRARSASHAKL
ncbi:hypothetical protein Taro_023998 [Colocasia esculenta]|uniref:Uncharacterized protein n=1 Tax=Colocasia esculenta TaxID=4460 RepID=A0A843V5M6_COLES|nr:hypothetical protein [Colocasia esculenta]